MKHFCVVVALVLLPSVVFAIPDVVVLHILDDVHPSQLDDYRTDTASHPGTTYQFATPSLDAIADLGVRFNHFYGQTLCTPGRSQIWGFGPVGTTDNLMGYVQSGLTPPPFTIDLRAGGPSLISAFHDAGYLVAGFGKLHMGRERVKNFPGTVTWPAMMGFDTYEAMVQSNDGRFGACADLRTFPLGAGCESHNYWCRYALDADTAGVSIMGDGSNTVGASNDYVDAEISEAAQDYLTNTALVGGKHLVVIGWHGPHAGWHDADGASSGAVQCDYDDNGAVDLWSDDRPPGSAIMWDETDGAMPVYGAQLEFVDTQIGVINGLLDLTAGGANHLAVVVADNGVANGGTNAECLLSRGRKGTVWECGVNVPLALYGDDVVEANAEVLSLFEGPDLPKTLASLVGGNLDRVGGYSFADCLTNSNGKSPSNCPGRDVVVHTEWQLVLGGADGTDGTPIGENPYPPRDGDTALEWSEYNLGAVTDTNNGLWKLTRFYQMNVVLGPYCEILMEITGADPYLATATTPIDETSCTGTYGGPISCSGCDADQQGAYDVMRRELDKRRNRIDVRPSFSGSM